MYKALDISKYIITTCVRNNLAIDNIYLQSILWFIQIAFVENFKKLAFSEEIFAGDQGPEVKEVHNIYVCFGPTKIILDYGDDFSFGEEEKQLIWKITQVCLCYGVWDLKELTKGDLWHRYRGTVIPQEKILQLFSCRI